MMRNLSKLGWMVVAWSCVAGCVGNIGDDGAIHENQSTPSTDDAAPTALPMNRLSTGEYDRTVRDLLMLDPSDLTTAPSSGFPSDDIIEKYSVGYSVSSLEVERAEAAAERLGNLAMKHPERFLPCEVESGDDACAKSFIETFGQRAYRRPLSDAEQADLFATYRFGVQNGSGFADGIELTIQTALLSPYFLFHVATATPPSADGSATVVDVTDWEMASRLSYFIWGTMPDDALFAAASSGTLRTSDQVAAQAERMLADPRAHDAMGSFLEQTFEASKIASANRDATLYPDFDASVATSLSASYKAFLDDAFWNGGHFDDFYKSNKLFVDGTLAPLYGFSQVTEMTAVEGPDDQRMGLLTQPGFLTLEAKFDRSDPIHRGVFIVKNVLCRSLGDPPPNAANAVPDPTLPQHTTRQQIEAKTANPACQSCHGTINPLGFGLEAFDAMGRFRSTQQTDVGELPIDPSGSGTIDDNTTSWTNQLDLANAVAGSHEARRCFAQNLYRFANPRAAVAEDDREIDHVTDDFVASGEALHALVLRLVKSPSFTKRLVQ